MVFFITKCPGRKRSERIRANEGCCIMPRQQQKGDGEKEARERGYKEYWESVEEGRKKKSCAADSDPTNQKLILVNPNCMKVC